MTVCLKLHPIYPADGLLNLALTCTRFSIGGNDSLSLVEETARRIVNDIATVEEKNALPGGMMETIGYANITICNH